MKKLILVVMAVCLVTGFALAVQTKAPSVVSPSSVVSTPVAPATMTLEGVIIDNMCAGSQKPGTLAAFVKTHSKSCALMPQCQASGYSIYSSGALLKFDAKSNAKIAEFLKKPESKLQVVVVVNKEPLNALSLVSIKNK